MKERIFHTAGETADPIPPGFSTAVFSKSASVSDQDRRAVISVTHGKMENFSVSAQAPRAIIVQSTPAFRGVPAAHWLRDLSTKLGGVLVIGISN